MVCRINRYQKYVHTFKYEYCCECVTSLLYVYFYLYSKVPMFRVQDEFVLNWTNINVMLEAGSTLRFIKTCSKSNITVNMNNTVRFLRTYCPYCLAALLVTNVLNSRFLHIHNCTDLCFMCCYSVIMFDCFPVLNFSKFKVCIMLMFDAFIRVLWHVFLVRL
jgi:hypothetical protein